MPSNSLTRRPWFPLLFLLLALCAFLAMGALKLQRNYQTRGIEPGLPPPIAHGGAELGLNVALEQYEPTELEEELDQISDTGVRMLKQSFYFTEPFNWEQSDRIIGGAERHQMEIVALLDGDPQQSFAPPDNPTTYGRWAGDFASRYKEQVRYYIIWDEPNLGSHWGNQSVNPSAYAALLSAAASAIRAVDSDAVIVAAPLAPTIETGPQNLADPLFLSSLYEVGVADAFDVVAGKPYGFDSGPHERTVNLETLNFSRAILLREVMHRHGDAQKALFAGNWGWNHLPEGWQGSPSIWGQTNAETQVHHTLAALERARREWPWMGLMFLENWEPNAAADNPRWGFSVANRQLEEALKARPPAQEIAYPGYHLAQPDGTGQSYSGGWRFSAAYGADISQSGDRLTLHFWGTDVGLRVRRADYRARLYVSVDGQDASALPDDGNGSALVLTSATTDEDYLSTEVVARDLPPGEHTLTVVAHRGWDQWALNGFNVAYHPPARTYRLAQLSLALLGAMCLFISAFSARRVAWATVGQRLQRVYTGLGEQARIAVTFLAAAIVALSGWLTWGEQTAGLYRRLGDVSQLALTAAAASLFYITPFFFLYLLSLIALFFLVYARPAWGLALIAFSFPFYVVPKPMLGYRFSPVEIFIVLVTLAFLASRFTTFVVDVHKGTEGNARSMREAAWQELGHLIAVIRARMVRADIAVFIFVAVATLSLFFTERLDVAENEWRMVIVEPALFYFLFRTIRPEREEMWAILDAFVLGGLTVAAYGLWTFIQGENVITVAGGLGRLHSVYGSPNNVALYLGRIVPLLLAMTLMGQATQRRQILYTVILLPIGLALLLTFSKGALFLGIPAAVVTVFILWRRVQGRHVWTWLLAGAALAVLAIMLALNHPALAGRFNIQGTTSLMRVNLWRASVNMFAENPFFGVGLDNFLYAYRSRYILDAAWAEPDLNHPHNIILDFSTRLGLFGLFAGTWLFYELARRLWRLPSRVRNPWCAVAVGLLGAFAQMLAHGFVDHSFFLVDLALVFYLMLGLSIWLYTSESVT